MPVSDGYILFCEDVREEANKKISYLGMLGTAVVADAPGPVVFPRLFVCGVFTITNEPNIPALISITLDPPSMDMLEFSQLAINETPAEGVWQLRLNVCLQGFTVPAGTLVTARYEVGGFVKASSLEIRAPLTVNDRAGTEEVAAR